MNDFFLAGIFLARCHFKKNCRGINYTRGKYYGYRYYILNCHHIYHTKCSSLNIFSKPLCTFVSVYQSILEGISPKVSFDLFPSHGISQSYFAFSCVCCLFVFSLFFFLGGGCCCFFWLFFLSISPLYSRTCCLWCGKHQILECCFSKKVWFEVMKFHVSLPPWAKQGFVNTSCTQSYIYIYIYRLRERES